MRLTEGMELSTCQIVRKVLVGGLSEVAVLESTAGFGMQVLKRVRDDIRPPLRDAVEAAFLQECLVMVHKLAGAPYTVPARNALQTFDHLGAVLFMDYVDGPSLADLTDRGPLSLSQVVRVGGQVAQALRYGHEQGVRHRDLKPNNILLTTTNEVRVADWGLARANALAWASPGVVDYFGPERQKSSGYDHASDDIHALGAILYLGITGGLPDLAASASQIGDRMLHANGLVPDRLATLVLRMLSATEKNFPAAAECAQLLTDPGLLDELRVREFELPYCCCCPFVSRQVVATCEVCGNPMYYRPPRPPAPGMIRIPGGTYVHGLSEVQAHTALITAGLPLAPQLLAQLAPKSDPQTRQYCRPFDIDATPVTNAAYRAFVEEVGYPAPDHLHLEPQNRPVAGVTWKDATCYALWAGSRLPTREEWEKAARGDADDRMYPWGNTWDPSRCNHNRNPITNSTSDVDTFVWGDQDGRSPFKLIDAVGNVREWIAQGREAGYRGLRGGGWSGGPLECLIPVEVNAPVDFSDGQTGFRCAKDVIYDTVPIESSEALGRAQIRSE